MFATKYILEKLRLDEKIEKFTFPIIARLLLPSWWYWIIDDLFRKFIRNFVKRFCLTSGTKPEYLLDRNFCKGFVYRLRDESCLTLIGKHIDFSKLFFLQLSLTCVDFHSSLVTSNFFFFLVIPYLNKGTFRSKFIKKITAEMYRKWRLPACKHS